MTERIPGIFSTPTDIPAGDGIQLLGFNLKSYVVPESHRYGACRLLSEFEKMSSIGSGSYGTFFKVKEKRSAKVLVLKKMQIPTSLEVMPLFCIREISLLKSFHHANIISTSGIAVGRNFDSLYIILEYCPYVLSKILADRRLHSLLNQSQIKNIMHQLFCGLDYLHKCYVVHRDLTPSNILFNYDGILKISDFGDSRTFDEEDNVKTPNKVSPMYRAPEILLGSTTYSSPVDIWSAGCIFSEMLLKRPIFDGKSDNDVISLIVMMLGTPNESTWPGLSRLPVIQEFDLMEQPYNMLRSSFASHPSTAVALLHKLFLYYPKARFTAEQSYEHPYFTEDQPLACDLETLLGTLRRCPEL